MKNKIFTSLLTNVSEKKGASFLNKLENYAENANSIQETLLMKIVKDNSGTDYGKKYNFDKIKSLKDYKNTVPLSTYEDYDAAIYKMTEGEKNLLTAYPIAYFAESSGSTGRPKLIPISGKAMDICFNFGLNATTAVAERYFKNQGQSLPPQRGLLTMEVTPHKLPCKKTSNDISMIPILKIKPYTKFISTSPSPIMFPKDNEYADMHYLKLRFALAENDITFMGTIFITMLESMFVYLEKNWRTLADDIENGTINKNVQMSERLREKLLKKCKPDKIRAEELCREFEKGFDDPIVPRIWKNVGWLYGMGTGSIGLYEKKLRKYIGNKMPLHYLGYAASEGLMAIPIELNSTEFVMLPQSGFYEFLPIGAEENAAPLTMSELEVGREYEIILTNLSGLYRYRIEDVIRVTGFYGQCPKITFLYRLNQVANINDEKISMRAFDLIMDNLSKRFSDEFKGYSIYADRDRSPGRYVILIESAKDVSKRDEEKYAEEFDKELCASNPLVYPQLRNGALSHSEVKFISSGTYEEYRNLKKQNGGRLNQFKPVKIINSDEKRDFFFNRVMA